jgi:hypothetical protein
VPAAFFITTFTLRDRPRPSTCDDLTQFSKVPGMIRRTLLIPWHLPLFAVSFSTFAVKFVHVIRFLGVHAPETLRKRLEEHASHLDSGIIWEDRKISTTHNRLLKR